MFSVERVAVFVDGCFWHSCPEHRVMPTANSAWWSEKLGGNQQRDLDTVEHLLRLGWMPLRFWEHEDPVAVADSIQKAVLRRRGSVDHSVAPTE